MRKLLKTLFLICLLSGCSSTGLYTATTIPTPGVWQVAYSSELGWMTEDFNRCLPASAGVGIISEETQVLQAAGNNADLMLHWGDVDPQGLSAYQLGLDSITVIVHPDNPLSEIQLDDLRSIYAGQTTDWSALSAGQSGMIHPWVYSQHLQLQKAAEEVLGMFMSVALIWISPLI